MDEQAAGQLALQIRTEAPYLQAEVQRRGYPGYDESWLVKVSIQAGGVTTSMELEDAQQWAWLRASIQRPPAGT
jgi:hypothetical protein